MLLFCGLRVRVCVCRAQKGKLGTRKDAPPKGNFPQQAVRNVWLTFADEESSLTNRHCRSLDGRKKIEDMYHPITERSEFYTMADVLKPPVLFTPSEELEKVSPSCLDHLITRLTHLSVSSAN